MKSQMINAAQIAELQLPADFVGGFHVGFEGGGFGVAEIAGFATVDVNGHDGFGGIDDQRTAAGQWNVTAVHQLDFTLDAEFVEHRNRIFIQLDFIPPCADWRA